VRDITLSSYDNITTEENMQFLSNDKNKVKNVFIGDDFFYEANKDKNIALLRDLTDQPKIILLPCLHDVNISNPCSYNNDQISDNCRIFNGDEIDTTLYTDFYRDDKIRKPSYIYYSNRRRCKDTNLISLVLNAYYSTASSTNRIEENEGGRRKKSTKKQKKTRKPRKKSRKTRKHKKLRKH
jgi:hypothetical protein